MAKQKPVKIPPPPEQVYSKKYRCMIYKDTAYFDEVLQDWLNVKIEESLQGNSKFS
jgi:hypothetical protein